jgi:hypothetical protein
MKVIERSALADRLYCRRCKISRPALTKWEAKARRESQKRHRLYDAMRGRV